MLYKLLQIHQTVVKKYFILALSVGICFCEAPQKKDSTNDIKINADNTVNLDRLSYYSNDSYYQNINIKDYSVIHYY